MTVSHEHLHFAKVRLNANAPVGGVWTSDLDSRSLCHVGDDSTVRECNERADESVGAIARDVDPILRYVAKWLIGWRREVPGELHIHPARPLDDGIKADGIAKRRDDNVSSGLA